jgi:S1-C subfamily serine protease
MNEDYRLKQLYLLSIVVLSLLLAACQGRVAQPIPPSAVASTPVADLPMNTAFQQRVTAVPQEIINAADAEYLLLTNIYERVAPSVVNIDVTVRGVPQGFRDTASGSGIVYDTNGNIITNAHVVNDASSIRVTFNNGYVADAELIGLDVYSDLAVVRVDVDTGQLVPVIFGNSDAVRVGQRAIAIGNPFGLASSMTAGIVSGLGRQLPSAQLIDVSAVGGFSNPSIIQVDAEINPGNSGGPLLNSAGELIGVNTAIRTETGIFAGIGFAVPSRTVERIIPELIENGRMEYAWIGISTLPADGGFTVAGLAAPLNLPVTAGVLVTQVTPNSPAANAGLRGGTRELLVRDFPVCAGGDIIVAVNGQYVNTMDELVSYLVVNTRPDETINLLIVRGDETFEVPLTLQPRPSDNTALPLQQCGAS